MKQNKKSLLLLLIIAICFTSIKGFSQDIITLDDFDDLNFTETNLGTNSTMFDTAVAEMKRALLVSTEAFCHSRQSLKIFCLQIHCTV